MTKMSDLEDVASRYKSAAAVLDTVRTEMQTTAVELLRQEGVKQADVARITGWSREYLRRLKEKAELETLRQQVEKLSADKKPSPAVTGPRAQVTQALPNPAPLDLTDISPEVAALPLARVQQLAASAEARQPKWVAEIRGEYPDADEVRLCYLIVDVGFRQGHKPPELAESMSDAAERPEGSEETTT